ncbi:MAG: methionyl-tRNA formyltransferase [Planctomycetota bacterium]|nr:methionyl-tRNA formyltransferase [Planctomycetota bacterium]
MIPLRLVMTGTGEFALPTLETLYATGHVVAALYTQPDRIAPGRKKQHENRMKDLALSRGTPVFQPPNVNTAESLAELRGLDADVFVVAAYGQILSTELLGIPKLAAINVHASLLPRHRGAAPVAYAIWKGDAETGVSIIQILPQLDAGPVLSIVRTPIDPHETAGQLEDRLAILGAALVPDAISQLQSGTVRPVPQDPTLVTRCPKMKKELGEIDWNESPRQIDCRVRAMQPWPGPYSFLHTSDRAPERLMILTVRAGESTVLAPNGAVVSTDRGLITVQAQGGLVEIVTVQPPGKRPMAAAEFLRGHPLSAGARLGSDTTV